MKRLTLISLCLITCIILCYLQFARIYNIRILYRKNISLTKSDVEIVVAAYGEDINWLNKYSHLVTIYQKKKDSNNTSSSKVIHLPNVGRESHTYLHHIVNEYHNLANLTVFIQGTKPSYGYTINEGGGHFYCPLTLYDYITAKDGLFIFTEVMSLSNGRNVIRNGYNNYAKRKKNRCIPQSQNIETILPNKCFSLDDYESYTDNIGFIVHIAKDCHSAKDTLSLPYPCSKISFWNKYIKLPLPPKNFLYYSQGAIFSATREQIHRRPLSDYKLLLDDFNNSNRGYLGFLMEYYWYPLITSESKTCNEDKYYNSNSTSKKLQTVLKFLQCKECGVFNDTQYINMKIE